MDDLCSALRNGSLSEREQVLAELLRASDAPTFRLNQLRQGILAEFISDFEKSTDGQGRRSIVEVLATEFVGKECSSRLSVKLKMDSLRMLRNLSRSQSNKSIMFEQEGLFDSLISIVGNSSCQMELRELSIVIINNLANSVLHISSIVLKPGLVTQLVHIVRTTDSDRFREWTLAALMNIATHPGTTLTLYDEPNLVNTLVEYIESKTVACGAREFAIGCLGNLMRNSIVVNDVLRRRSLIPNLLHLSKHGESDIVKDWSRGFLRCMNINAISLKFFDKIIALCSVRDVLRLGKISPFRIVTGDMIRCMAEALKPIAF